MNRLLSIAIVCVCASCVSHTDIQPVYVGVIEACRQVQEHAIEHAETREAAIDRVNEVRRRCDIAYAGIEIAAEILEESGAR